MTELISEELPTTRQNPFDPPAEVTQIREQARISRLKFADGHLGWLVTGHHQVREILGSPKFTNNPEKHHLLDKRFQGEVPEEGRKVEPGMFLSQDPPDHTRLRKMLQGQFTVRRMNQLSEWIGTIVDDQLKHLRTFDGKADLVKEFALPVPSLVICALLGVDYDERHRFQDDTATMLSLEVSFKEAMAAFARIQDFMRELIARKKANPGGDDMISDLLATGEPTDEEASNMAMLLLLAGHETTANMLGIGTFTLLQHPDQLKILKDEPEVIDNAVEELMRYLSIIHFGPVRTAAEDVEIDGHLIKAGDTVLMHVPAANRDPDKFPGNPEELDLRRPASGHVAFGHGIHQCLGQQLARIEMRIGFSKLFQEFPDLRLDVEPEEVPLRTDMGIYGVHSLPVAWSA
ncbi:cytochrome P450 [Lentzea sp. BCCO 10_0856]|uniref:Cytochrome P450 n=1 Tax=Lentzea miocenica TaxID=3095431 RepID=A0ABU4TAC3_9PSEU|nr:cytochrome P450 [Lentzea sp. BCCO 10_0856]MDX8035004.1 cytochrome P450 [Lentzea sp. BCCO 10_0856]